MMGIIGDGEIVQSSKFGDQRSEGRRQEAGDRRQFQAAASNVKNIHPRPAEAGHPRRRWTRGQWHTFE